MHKIYKFDGGGPTGGMAGAITSTIGGKGGSGLVSGASPTPWGMIGGAADAIGGFLPLPSEYSGDKGAITAGMDSAYDKISDSIAAIPGWGTAASAIMKGNKLLGKGVKALGGGTDGMTTQDAIFGSAFMLMTPLGMINGFGGSKTDTMSKDYNTWSTMGSSYGGSLANFNDAMAHLGKKYGLFSQGAKNEANEAIHAAGRMQNTLSTISDLVNMTNNVLANQTDIAGMAYANLINGGYDQSAMRAAKQGMKLFSKELRERTALILAKKQRGGTVEFTPFVFDVGNITKFKKGEKSESKEDKLRELTNTYEKFVKYLKEHGDRANDSDYNLKAFYESTDTFEDENGNKLTPYEFWLKSEAAEPGYGHMIDEFKQPWHITYGGEDGSNWREEEDGWTYYVPEGHKNKNGREYTWDDYAQYFSDPEGQRSHFVYKGKRYDGAKLLPNITVTPEMNYYLNGGLVNSTKKTLSGILPSDSSGKYYISDVWKHFRVNDLDLLSYSPSVVDEYVKLLNNPDIDIDDYMNNSNSSLYNVYTQYKQNNLDYENLSSLNRRKNFINSLGLNELTEGTKYYKEINGYKNGGQMNVIPEGALHARKHEIFESNPELKGQITEKGIPVVVEGKEPGEVELLAEIELNEIIFNKEVTTKLEELAKKYASTEISNNDKEVIAIEAGKLLALEIMENTDDRTGLIQEIK